MTLIEPRYADFSLLFAAYGYHVPTVLEYVQQSHFSSMHSLIHTSVKIQHHISWAFLQKKEIVLFCFIQDYSYKNSEYGHIYSIIMYSNQFGKQQIHDEFTWKIDIES